MTQIATKWTPTPKQAGVLEAAKEAGLKRTITAITEAGGVSRKTFYRWIDDDPGFADAWYSIWRGAIERHLPGAIAALVHQAQSGDVAAIRLMCDLAGVLIRRSEVAGDQGGPVVVQFVRPEEGI